MVVSPKLHQVVVVVLLTLGCCSRSHKVVVVRTHSVVVVHLQGVVVALIHSNNNTMFTLDAMHTLLLQDGKMHIYIYIYETGRNSVHLLPFFQNIYYQYISYNRTLLLLLLHCPSALVLCKNRIPLVDNGIVHGKGSFERDHILQI